MRRYFLLGTTASGKTPVGLQLAPLLNAEILSLDSMLLYRGMDIGTAKPTLAERAQVPHHLIDLVGPNETYSAARWVDAARAVESELSMRGKAALYVGGTALYLKALLHGLPQDRRPPEGLSASLSREWEAEGGPASLRAELERVDPQAAERIHWNDVRRLLRALEHWRAFGEPWSAAAAPWPKSGALSEPAVALHWPRATLHARILRRFEQMMEDGFLEEVRRLNANPGFGATARLAIGYRELLAHLEDGLNLDTAVAHAVRATKVLVRRQATWLRSFPDLQELECSGETDLGEVARAAARLLGAG